MTVPIWQPLFTYGGHRTRTTCLMSHAHFYVITHGAAVKWNRGGIKVERVNFIFTSFAATETSSGELPNATCPLCRRWTRQNPSNLGCSEFPLLSTLMVVYKGSHSSLLRSVNRLLSPLTAVLVDFPVFLYCMNYSLTHLIWPSVCVHCVFKSPASRSSNLIYYITRLLSTGWGWKGDFTRQTGFYIVVENLREVWNS